MSCEPDSMESVDGVSYGHPDSGFAEPAPNPDPAAWLESRRSAVRAKSSAQQPIKRPSCFPRFVPEVIITSSSGAGGGSPSPSAPKPQPPPKPQKPVVVANWQQSMGLPVLRLSPVAPSIPPSLCSPPPSLGQPAELCLPSLHLAHREPSAQPPVAQMPSLPFSFNQSELSAAGPAESSSVSGAGFDDSNHARDDDSASDFKPRSPVRRRGLQTQSRPKRKVGRPIAFQGDPDDPELTETERRRIKRRIANRESARRVRKKRAESLDDMQAKKDVLHQAHLKLRAHASSATSEQSKLQGRLHSTRMEWAAASQANQHMVDDLQKLRTQLGSGLGPRALPGLDAAMDSRSPFAAAARQLQPQGGSHSSRGTSFSMGISTRSRRSSELLDVPPALPANPAALLQEAWRANSGGGDLTWNEHLDVADLLQAPSRELQIGTGL